MPGNGVEFFDIVDWVVLQAANNSENANSCTVILFIAFLILV